MDECLEIIRAALSGEYFEHHSENYDIGMVKLIPAPGQPVPILIGGHAKPALRRAARLGDGWISANTDLETLQGLIAQLNAFREEYGACGDGDFEIHALDSNLSSVDDCHKLSEIGVTDICVTPWNPYKDGLSRQDKLEAIERFSDTVIARVGETG
jgi:hypothetical protein